MIDYGMFRTSLERLDEQHENYRNSHAGLSDLMKEAIAESVIQRFKACYDCLWKVLRRYLFEFLGVVDPPNSPKPVLRLRMRTTCCLRRWRNGFRTLIIGMPLRMTTMERRPKHTSMT